MSFRERSNWKDPSHQRRYRLFIPLAVGLVLIAGVIVAVNTKSVLTAFGGSAGCATPSATPTAGTPRPGPGRLRLKGGEAVQHGYTPAARPTGKASPPVTGMRAPGAADQGGTALAADDAAARPLTTPAKAADDAGPGVAADGAAARPLTAPTSPAATPAAGSSAGAPAPSTGAGAANSATPIATATAPTAPAASSSAPTTPAAGTPTQSPSAGPSACPSPTGQGNQPPAAADPNADCTLIVPPHPLTAQGLATPYQLMATDAAMGPCNEANVNQTAFVQATILDPATGKLSVYSPLVVDRGATPAVAPTPPTLPARAVVGIWFGYNGAALTLRDMNGSLWQGRCVNGLGRSVFGQFAYCNAPSFFRAANRAIRAGRLTVPPLGTANDGMPCMSTRDFALIDQDQSDNVQTTYLATGNGQIAQNTAANKAKLANTTTLANPSDNALLDVFVDPALGCKAAMVPDLADNGAMTFSLAMDELQAAAGQAAPVALVPANDPMVQVNGHNSVIKTDLYRAGVDMPLLPAGQTPAQYCRQMTTIQAARLQKDTAMLGKAASPMADAANNLFGFLGMRLQQAFGNLNCQNFGLRNPVAKLLMQNNVVVGVQFANGTGTGATPPAGGGTSPTAAPPASPTPTPKPTRPGPRRHHGPGPRY